MRANVAYKILLDEAEIASFIVAFWSEVNKEFAVMSKVERSGASAAAAMTVLNTYK